MKKTFSSFTSYILENNNFNKINSRVVYKPVLSGLINTLFLKNMHKEYVWGNGQKF